MISAWIQDRRRGMRIMDKSVIFYMQKRQNCRKRNRVQGIRITLAVLVCLIYAGI